MCFFRKKIDLHFISTAFIIVSLLYHNLTIFSTIFYEFLEVTLTEEDRPENEKDILDLNYNFLDYSYEENLDGTPNGSISTNIPDWKIGVLKFTEEIQIFQIEMIFTNYTEFPIEIQVKVTGNGLYDNNILNLDTNQSNIYNYTLTKNMLNKDEIDGVSFSVKAYKAYSKNFTT